jgi:hypothetical protein
MSGLVTIVGVVAVAFGLRSADLSVAAQPSTGPGSIRLEQRGANCVIADKSPLVTVVAAGGAFSWLVRNDCAASVTIDMREKRRRNSDATTDDPVSSFSQSPNPIPARSQGTVDLRAKTQAELRPDPQRRPRKHAWEFRWFVNGQRQNDPELEVEYRW